MNISVIDNETIRALFFTPLHKIVSVIPSDDRIYVTIKTDHSVWGLQVHKIKLETSAALSTDPDDHSADSHYISFSKEMRKLVDLAEQFGEAIYLHDSFKMGRIAVLVNYLGDVPPECDRDEFLRGLNFTKEQISRLSK